MKITIASICAILIIMLLSCGKRSSYYSQDSYNDYEYYQSINGSYCARVEYYNPATGTHSTYTLSIEIEEDELKKIYFPNGGYISPNVLISSGSTDFYWDDGTHFQVEVIQDSECSNTDDFSNDDNTVYNFEEESISNTDEEESSSKGLDEY